MPPAVTKALKDIGLSDKEVAVLVVLLEHGSMLVSAIAKQAKINRTTAYGLLKELMAKSLVSQVKKEGADRFQSIAPELLPAYIERRRDLLAESKKTVEEAVPQIKLLRTKGKSLPKVQFFEGAEGVQQAYEDTLENNKGKKLYDITGVDAAYRNLDPKFVDYYLSKRAKLGIECIDLAPESEWAHKSKADDNKYLRTTKLLPPQYKFDAELSIYDNKVGIFSYAQKNPVALIIEDDTISDMMKKLFDYMESTAEK